MLCQICFEKVYTKKTIINLFDREVHHICEKCYKRFPLFPRHQIIPIERYVINHFLLSIKNHHHTTAYMSFLKPYYLSYLKYFKKQIILYFDYLDDIIFQILDSLKFGDIVVVTLYENIEEKGE